MCGALEGVRDLESAQQANEKLNTLAADLDRAFADATKDGKPSPADAEPYRERMQQVEGRMRRAGAHLKDVVGDDRELALALLPSLLKLQQVGKRMQSFAATAAAPR